MNKVYLASQFARQSEMRRIRDMLEKNPNVKVVAKWIDEEPFDHEPTEEELITMSNRDLDDLESADTFVLVNPPPYLGGPEELSRGGRMVEAGVALCMHVKLVVIGDNKCVHLAGGHWKKFETVEQFLNSYRPVPMSKRLV